MSAQEARWALWFPGCSWPGGCGVFVALDPDNGQVHAMGSLPAYDLNVLSRSAPARIRRRLTGARSGFPLINRATQSTGPVGSALAPITALAALEGGAMSSTTWVR